MNIHPKNTPIVVAREYIGRAVDIPLAGEEAATSISTRAVLASAIADVEIAEAARVDALVNVLRYDASGITEEKILTPAERERVVATIRSVLGLTYESE